MSQHERAREVFRYAEELGYRIEHTKQGHLKCMHPLVQKPVVCAPHSKCPRVMMNIKTMLRRKLNEARSNLPPTGAHHGIR